MGSKLENNRNIRLIVDSDPQFVAAITKSSKEKHANAFGTPDWKLAQQILAETTHSFAAIFINPALKSGYGFSVVRFAHRFRPATPIYLVQDKDQTPLTNEQLHRLGVHGC